MIVRQQPLAEHGEIVVASVDGEVTLKRLLIRDGDIRLMPENKNFKPIEIKPENELKILGRVSDSVSRWDRQSLQWTTLQRPANPYRLDREGNCFADDSWQHGQRSDH